MDVAGVIRGYVMHSSGRGRGCGGCGGAGRGMMVLRKADTTLDVSGDGDVG